MQTVVLLLMLLIGFNFIIKQTFHKLWFILLISLISALFVGFMWPMAIEQSKTQIAVWLENPTLMLDTSVILTIEVALQIAFCLMSVNRHNEEKPKKITLWLYRLLWIFPGVLIFAVLFSLLVAVIFQFTGISFSLLSWLLAAVVMIVIPLGTLSLKKLLPEKELRLELLFLSNALLAILGVVATVNGRTAVEGFSQIDWAALIGLIVLVILGIVCGFLLRKIYWNKIKKNQI